jgi:hypothetical protein
MLAAALEAEVAAYIAAHIDQLDDNGRRLVVRKTLVNKGFGRLAARVKIDDRARVRRGGVT